MKRHAFIVLLGMLMVPQLMRGQTATEAFRISESDPLGTARNLGTGNSMFAIGPDFSAIGLNPSGLAGFRKSEFLFSFFLNSSNYNSAFVNDPSGNNQDAFTKMGLSNIGFVIHNQPRGSRWTSSNWAIGLNRVADYNKDVTFQGNTPGSITDAWRENASGLPPDELNGFEEGLAYSSGAIYDFEDDNLYESDYNLSPQYALYKQESNLTKGGKSELFIAYGADLDNKFMFGFSVGLPFVNYTETRIYEENDGSEDAIPFFNQLRYNSTINSTGYGLNARVGFTVKPTKFINVSAAFQSPTRLSMSDDFNTTLSYDFTDENNDGPITAESPFGNFLYSLRTPWSASGGIGIIAGSSGFLSAHVKYTDYSSMKFDYSIKGNGNAFEQIEREANNEIKTNYGSALQVNMGGELVLDYFRLRGGVTLKQSAFENDQSFDPSYHVGAGYRGDYFYADLGYKLTKEDEGYLPYETEAAAQPLVITEYTRHLFVATFGLKF